MFFPSKFRRCAALLALGISAALPLASVLQSAQSGAAKQEKPADPWTDAQVLHAADLVPEIAGAKGANSPTIIYVGFRTLFEGGHIPGSIVSRHGFQGRRPR